jgi:hypothetical protein
LAEAESQSEQLHVGSRVDANDLSLKEGEPMPKRMLMEQFHLTMTVPAGLTTVEYEAMRRTLHRKRFQKSLREAVRKTIQRHPSLKKLRIALER